MTYQTETATGALPLSGYTVVDLTQVAAGPFASMMLGDLGAEVIKIEAIGRGDRSRDVSPYPEYFDTVNRNKRSIELDLKSERGQGVARALLEDADVFVQSMKPGRIERFGLDYNSVREFNPSIVYCTVTGFGEGSPYQDVPAWDMLIQGMSGIMSMTGTEETPPLWSGLASGDLIAAMYASQSIISALFARETGRIEGENIEVPMLDAAISWIGIRAAHTFGIGEPFPRFGTRHPSAAPFGVYSCEDESIVIAAGTESLWERLCQVLDREDLLDDERFETIDKRAENEAELRGEIEPITESESGEYWVERMHENGVPAGPIYDTETVWDDEHVRRRGLRVTMEREGRADAEMIDNPVRFSNMEPSFRIPPQELGESTDEILVQYGYSEEEIREFRDDEVVG